MEEDHDFQPDPPQDQDAGHRLLGVDSADDRLRDRELGVRLDEVHAGFRHREALEVRNSIGFQSPVEEPIALLRDPFLDLGQDQGMAPIESHRGAMRRHWFRG